MSDKGTHSVTFAINGATEFYAIIGDPISQAKTPALINPLIAESRANAVLVPLHVPAADFDTILPALKSIENLKGLVVTYPFKERAMGQVDQIAKRATAVGGINAMRRNADGSWSGDIFDGVGLLNGVQAERAVRGARVLLIGAGGAGRAIGIAFAEAGAAEVAVFDLDDAKALALVTAIEGNFPACNARITGPQAAGFDILINATPVGMSPGDGLPAPIDDLTSTTTVVDIVPTIEPTELMRRAAEVGAPIIPGKAMTAGQAEALLRFFGIRQAND